MNYKKVITQLESLREDAKDRMEHAGEERSIYHDDYRALDVALRAVSKLKEEEEANKFFPIAVSELARVEIADRDYTEGGKKYFTFDKACAIEKKLNNGWRLPTRKEWTLICEEFACGDDGCLSGQLLIDKLGLGLNGWQYHEDQQVRGVGALGLYWSSVADSATIARDLNFTTASVLPSYGDTRARGFSVRLVRDVEKV